MPEMDEEQANGVAVRGRSVNTATSQFGNRAHTEFFHLFMSRVGRETA
jgi:hypothetical protein